MLNTLSVRLLAGYPSISMSEGEVPHPVYIDIDSLESPHFEREKTWMRMLQGFLSGTWYRNASFLVL